MNDIRKERGRERKNIQSCQDNLYQRDDRQNLFAKGQEHSSSQEPDSLPPAMAAVHFIFKAIHSFTFQQILNILFYFLP